MANNNDSSCFDHALGSGLLQFIGQIGYGSAHSQQQGVTHCLNVVTGYLECHFHAAIHPEAQEYLVSSFVLTYFPSLAREEDSHIRIALQDPFGLPGGMTEHLNKSQDMTCRDSNRQHVSIKLDKCSLTIIGDRHRFHAIGYSCFDFRHFGPRI